jgi:hypothetical protein
MRVLACIALVACGGSPAPEPQPASHHVAARFGDGSATWPVPAGWKHEVIEFPLSFATELPHRGVEELRFPPGFNDVHSPNYWTYAFVWRLDDAAELDATALAAELTAYFRGLFVGVDGDKHSADPQQITTTATSADGQFELDIHNLDGFHDGVPVHLVGVAARRTCAKGAVWTFALEPAGTAHPELVTVTAAAECGQSPVK